MDEYKLEAYTLECGLVLTWVGHDGADMPGSDIFLPSWASKKISDIVSREFARRNDVPVTPLQRKIFACGLWCQIYSPSDYMELEIGFEVQRLVASLVMNNGNGNIWGGVRKPHGKSEGSRSTTPAASAVRVIPIGILGTPRELVRVQQARNSPLVYSAITSVLKRAFRLDPDITFTCIPKLFFGEELVKTALLLEDLLHSEDELAEFDRAINATQNPTLV